LKARAVIKREHGDHSSKNAEQSRILNKRLVSAMVLDRLDAELADVSSADLKAGCQQECHASPRH